MVETTSIPDGLPGGGAYGLYVLYLVTGDPDKWPAGRASVCDAKKYSPFLAFFLPSGLVEYS